MQQLQMPLLVDPLALSDIAPYTVTASNYGQSFSLGRRTFEREHLLPSTLPQFQTYWLGKVCVAEGESASLKGVIEKTDM